LNIERRKRIDEIFTHALELDGEARDRYVIKKVEDDDMRQEVVNLLQAATSDRLDACFDATRERIWSEVIAGDDAEEDLTGQHAGHWRIAERIARGGLATVYKAYRDDGEFDQTVAFKVLRRGLDTDDVVARFRAERQILSTLDHPSIAQILDGGALPDGRPYLVLEYVDGEPITAHCDKFNIEIRGRVVLTIDILGALHHAHRHTLVHRDIKPSNILVSSDGNVTLLDFGIAKLLDPEALPGTSTLTRTGIALLTPGYCSPEQRAGESVTTASDIYQVGLVLYELLSGMRPVFVGDDQKPIDPSAPSQQIKGTRFYSQVHGDLDAIVMKAMHADPDQRYASATEMVADLERYLDGRPVEAQPDTVAYRLRKLTKRRPWLLPMAAIAVLGIASYVVTLTLYSRQLQLEQQRAEAAQKFMVDLLSSPDPFAPADPERGLNITVVEALELGRRRLENELAAQPELRATLLSAVAGVYRSLDQNDEAIELGEDALILNLDLYGESSEPVLENLRLLADGYDAIGEYARARDYYTRQLNLARSMYASSDPLLGLAEVAAGTFEKAQGNLDLGLALMESGIRSLQTAPDEHPHELISAIVNSTEQDGTNDAEASLRVLEEALQVAESTFGAESLYTAQVRIAIGRNALFAHDREKSEENYRYGLNILETQLGREHGSTITALQDYGVAMNVTGDYAGAEQVFRELVDRLVDSYGEDHRSVGDNYQNLATTLTRQGKYNESLPLHRKAYEVYKSVLEPDHYIIAFPLLSIGVADLELGNAAEAEAASREALQRLQATLPDSYVEGVARCLVGISLEQQGNAEEGTAMVESSHALIMKRDVLVPTYQKLCRVPENQP
jgi:serine/threonine-protein kinase